MAAFELLFLRDSCDAWLFMFEESAFRFMK